MRSITQALLAYVLALLLVGTSPVGAGTGAHQNQLLDALVPHMHFIDGKPVEKDNLSMSYPTMSPSGPVLGAGAGAAAASSGVAIVQPLPIRAIPFPADSERWSLAPRDDALPRGLSEAPPDPPPTA